MTLQTREWICVAVIAGFILLLHQFMQIEHNDRCINTITKIKIEHCR